MQNTLTEFGLFPSLNMTKKHKVIQKSVSACICMKVCVRALQLYIHVCILEVGIYECVCVSASFLS